MDVEIVRWNKRAMKLIEEKSFENVKEAYNYYTKWECPEKNKKDYYINGNNWNVASPEEKIPENYEYIYTYSVNILQKKCTEYLEHNHNFNVYKNKV
jgi:hypothetical protein